MFKVGCEPRSTEAWNGNINSWFGVPRSQLDYAQFSSGGAHFIVLWFPPKPLVASALQLHQPARSQPSDAHHTTPSYQLTWRGLFISGNQRQFVCYNNLDIIM